MKKIIFLLMNIFLICPLQAKPLKIITTYPFLADVVENIVKDKAFVESLSSGYEDPHFVDPRPSMVAKVRNADAIVVVGMSLDMWINGIIDAARNSDIVFGAQGYIDVSQNIKKLQVTEGKVDASMGHVHPDGNPHYFTNPENVKNIIDIVVKQLSGIAPEQTDFLTKNKEDYIAQLEEYITKWKKMFESFKGTKIITYHDSWPYFEEFSGLKIIEHIEPKPGIPPSPSHLQKLVNLIKNENVKLILSENYFSKKAPQFLKEKTGIKIIYVPVDLQKDQGIDSYIQLWDKNFQQMIEALK